MQIHDNVDTGFLLNLSGMPADALPVQPVWQKSSFSNSQGNCVEIGEINSNVVAMRDSKNPLGPVLLFERDDLRSFVTNIKNGLLDDVLEG